jgi:glycosyltransferase involved in cell wall biosynthesis
LNIGIDASNLRDGGGITHLTEILRAADPERHGFGQVHVWSSRATLDRIEARPWLTKHAPAILEDRLAARLLWQRFGLKQAMADAGCRTLFSPGGLSVGAIRPVVTMCRNMLPFSATEKARYGWSWLRLRFFLLRFGQARAFAHADGVIFLTQWAKLRLETDLRTKYRKSRIIPHGISTRFCRVPPPQLPLAAFGPATPFRWLYVSIVAPYKHQWNVAAAGARLREKGLPIRIDFVGPGETSSCNRLQSCLRRLDPNGEFLRYHGPVAYDELHRFYHDSHGFAFASSCENMPNILLEAMSAALPVASSDSGPMPEMLGDGGLFFDPCSPESIAAVMERYLHDVDLRRRCVARAVVRAQAFSWERCAAETFGFIREVNGNSTKS